MRVCWYACVYVCMYACTCSPMYICMCIFVHVPASVIIGDSNKVLDIPTNLKSPALYNLGTIKGWHQFFSQQAIHNTQRCTTSSKP